MVPTAQWSTHRGWGAASGIVRWTTLPCWSSDHPTVPTPPAPKRWAKIGAWFTAWFCTAGAWTHKALCDYAWSYMQETSRNNIKEPLLHASYIPKWYYSIVVLQYKMCASAIGSQPFGKTLWPQNHRKSCSHITSEVYPNNLQAFLAVRSLFYNTGRTQIAGKHAKANGCGKSIPTTCLIYDKQ